jgi:hypothetical protein
MQFTKTLVFINLALREIYSVLAYTTRNYKCIIDLSEPPVFSSGLRRTPFTQGFFSLVKAEVKAVPLHAKQQHKGDRGIALPILDTGLGRWWVVRATPRPLYPLEKHLVSTEQEAGWASSLVCMGPENLAQKGSS